MSSRVQKGSTVFRPVVKSRSRTANSASRQPSVLPEQSRTETLDTNSIPESIASSSPSVVHAPQVSQESESTQSDAFQDGGRDNSLENIPREEHILPRSSVAPPVVNATTIGIPIPPVQRAQAVPILVRAPQSQNTNSSPPLSISLSNLNQASTSSLNTTESSTVEQSLQAQLHGPQTSEEITDAMNPPAETTEVSRTNPNLDSLPVDDTTVTPDSRKGSAKRKKSQDNPLKRRKRRKSEDRDGEEGEAQVAPRKSRSGASSSTQRPRKRAPSPPPYDPDADPGEDIDPTTVTMASLCSDTGQGRVSSKAAEILSNHAAWKVKNREKRARMKALMEAKKYGREEEDAERDAEHNTPANEPNTSEITDAPAVIDNTGNGFDYSQDLTTSRYNVQVRIGANGAMVIDEESLVVDRVEDDGTEDYTHVVESDHTKFINSGTYGKRYRGSRWSAEETELFYDALAQYGENYELIAYVLPGRDRKSCKNKFKVEDKRNHARINHCLENSIPVDMKTLSRMTGKDFSGPVPEIRIPTPPPTVQNEETANAVENEVPVQAQQTKKRSRRGNNNDDGGLVVIGDAADFER